MPHKSPERRRAFLMTPEQKGKDRDRSRKRYADLTPEKREEKSERERKWRLDNPDRIGEIRRRANLKCAYGITPEEFDSIFQSQGESCAICKKKFTQYRWCLDHCHATEKVRGVLCHSCNTLLGHAKDNEQTLIDAVFYLLEHRRVNCPQ
jgi:hypothetical protein